MSNRIVILAIIVVALAAVLGISFAGDKEVVWTPGQVSTTAVWGHTSTSSVSFVSDKNLNKVAVLIDPKLKPYLSVTPLSVGKVDKGRTALLTLTISAPPNTPPQVLTGTIELTKEGKKVFDSLPVMLSIEPVVLPPDPGEAGRTTLAGIDSDGDGVRDDIQRYIALTYWDQSGVAAGLRQEAVLTQAAIEHSESKEMALQYSDQLDRSTNCLRFRIADLNKVVKMEDSLLSEILNTDERSRAYIRYDSHLGGIFPVNLVPKGTDCDSSSKGGGQ